ncbi:MAG: hypothetical protein QG635_1347, partial [Bacteroidota bacterium]|nr:hypothetical protein [Bacteroidota bacterium]
AKVEEEFLNKNAAADAPRVNQITDQRIAEDQLRQTQQQLNQKPQDYANAQSIDTNSMIYKVLIPYYAA